MTFNEIQIIKNDKFPLTHDINDRNPQNRTMNLKHRAADENKHEQSFVYPCINRGKFYKLVIKLLTSLKTGGMLHIVIENITR